MRMTNWICVTCGTQFPATATPPPECPICQDERQYVGHKGQLWTTLEQLKNEGFHSFFREEERNLIGIGIEPQFAIGQRALLIQTPAGNILWDCIPFLDEDTITKVKKLGGLKAIAISHPHYFSALAEWAEKLDVPVYLHEADRGWVMRQSDRIHFWEGDTLSLTEEVTLIRLGGHFRGSSVLHWKQGAEGRGALLTGDTIYVVADRSWVSFMYSYPNLIPLPAPEVRRIRDTVANCQLPPLNVYTFEVGACT
ncbi:MBL fold metallo-hydrolase [Effusibacillus consociatus]|uniref:MBL fold metallo-hydrolase n=1 Tax=Effusibacillus consociatus TaxID=1117041 RepID=A0ABV9Q3G1_9BACL